MALSDEEYEAEYGHKRRAKPSKPKDPERKPGPKGWQKGQSGNPGGRPAKFKEIRAIAQTFCGGAIRKLWKLANDEGQPGPVRVAAFREILDRGIGKPVQAVEVSGNDGEPVTLDLSSLSDEQIAKLLEIQSRVLKPRGDT